MKKLINKQSTITLLVLALVVAAIFGLRHRQVSAIGKQQANIKPPLLAVTTIKTQVNTWPVTLTSVGTIKASQNVDITPQTAGVVSSINFKSGQIIEKNEILITLDSSILQAKLKSALAEENFTKLTYQRNLAIFKKRVGAESTLDDSKAKLAEAEAIVEEIQAQIKQTKITAPFAGKLGISHVSLGQYLKPGELIASLQTLDPLTVQFAIPGKNVHKLQLGDKVKLKVAAFSQQTFTGEITALDGSIDKDTRSIMLEASIPNAKHLLYPGMFADVTVALARSEQIIPIPQQAILYTLYGDSVFVLKRKKLNWVAQQRQVTTGIHRGNAVAIINGLKTGELLVTVGQHKLHDGMQVTLKTQSSADGNH